MKKKFKLGVIGAGFMGKAIINGVLSSKTLLPSEIICSDFLSSATASLSEKGICTTEDNKFLVNNSEFVLFAVKPQSLADVLSNIKNCCCDRFISIMAGVKKDRIKSVFPNSCVARCMPNTPCSIQKGAIGIDLSDFTEEDDKKFVESLFSSIAKVVVVNEDKMNAVTGVSGSSPAYFYMFVKGIIDAGVKHGLTESEAKSLAISTMIGSAEMVLNSDKPIDELINAVCSKGGTTLEAVKVFNDNDLHGIIEKAVDACVKRSKELESL